MKGRNLDLHCNLKNLSSYSYFITNKNRFPILIALTVFCIVFALTGCASTPTASLKTNHYRTKPKKIEQLLRAEANRWKGTPYRSAGTSRKGVDCSGLVLQLYKNVFDIRLPRLTKDQARAGIFVSRSRIRPGDLVFFRPPNRKRHVGVYLGSGEFVHASSSRGVMISNINSPYWRKIFWKARRVL